MKSRDVQGGGIYAAKVNGRLVPVRVIGSSPNGGTRTKHFRVRSLRTGREVVKSARQILYPVVEVEPGRYRAYRDAPAVSA